MTSSMTTILLIGATSGIGEQFARRLHALGKHLIITGRRQERLEALQQELNGLEIRRLDITDFAALPDKVSEILKSFPDIDTVFLNAGMSSMFSLADPATSSNEHMLQEINTNFAAPMILTRLLLPYLVAKSKERPANILFTSSGLAFIPLGMSPAYCPAKAGIHSLCVVLRQQLATVGAKVSVIEIAPPYVDTALDASFREKMRKNLGEKAPDPMPLQEYMDSTMATLNKGDASQLKEVACGFAQIGVDTWRGSFGKVMEGMGIIA